jgi:hypothetical protein
MSPKTLGTALIWLSYAFFAGAFLATLAEHF